MSKMLLDQFECDTDLLRDLLKLLIAFDCDKIMVSEEFFFNELVNSVSQSDKHTIESKNIKGQPFSTFYSYLISFYDQIKDMKKIIAHHISFKFNIDVVWASLLYISNLKGSFKIKKAVLRNHLKNEELYFNSEKYIKEIDQIVDELTNNIKDNNPLFTIDEVEGSFFLLSKFITLTNYLRINRTVIQTVPKIIQSENLIVDSQSITELNDIVELVSRNTYANMTDEMILGADTIDDNLESLNYPICPISMFSKLRLFQEKRIFLFVGAGGVGKSMLLSHITSEMWTQPTYKKADREGIFYFTMENLKEEVAARIYANAFYRFCNTNRTIDDVIQNLHTVGEKNQLKEMIRASGRDVIIDYLQPGIHGTITFKNLIKRKVLERGIVPYAIIVDFMDKMRSNNQKNKLTETQELGNISDELKALASELSVPVITVSHLNSEGCKVVKEDMAKLGGGQVGKSLRKFESFDVVGFMDEEDTGMGFTVMNFYFSKHRYFKKSIGKIHSFRYLPEYSYFEILDPKLFKQDKNNIDNFCAQEAFDDPTLGL